MVPRLPEVMVPRNSFDKMLMFRIGLFYPNVTSDFDMADCPPFWQTRKIEINLLNMKDEEYMDNIQLSAYIAIALDLLVGIGSFLYVWNRSKMPTVFRNSEDKLGPFKMCRGFGKFKFFITKILLGFGMPLVDTAFGKRKLFEKFYR